MAIIKLAPDSQTTSRLGMHIGVFASEQKVDSVKRSVDQSADDGTDRDRATLSALYIVCNSADVFKCICLRCE